MSAQNNEVNRTIDGDIAEGHIRARDVEDATELAEGHARANLDEQEEARRQAIRQIHSLDDEAEGHLRVRD